jgi:hypothetical protein
MESNPERFEKNDQHKGTKIPAPKRKKIEELLLDGMSAKQVSGEVQASRNTVIAIRDQMEDAGKFDLGSWKKQTVSNLAKFVNKGSTRLEAEVENIPAGQLPLALAIAIDKIMALQDAPAVVVEHRLRISADDINGMLKVKKQDEFVDVSEPKKDIDEA